MVFFKNEKLLCFLVFVMSFSFFIGCIFFYEFDDYICNVFFCCGFNVF